MRIADTIWRRRVGMRFLFIALQEDRQSYQVRTRTWHYSLLMMFQALKDRYVAMFFQCLTPGEIEMEHEFVSQFLTIDHSKDALLSEVYRKRRPSYSKDELLALRVEMIRGNALRSGGNLSMLIDAH
jgi:hypothetical protein